MTRIDFYVLSGTGDDPYLTSCRLVAKASSRQHSVYIHTASEADATHVDDLLWTFKDVSFVPHKLESDTTQAESQVSIGFGGAPQDQREILVNLAEEVPDFFSRFERVIEFVPIDAEPKKKARERYKFYRDRGYSLNTHNL